MQKVLEKKLNHCETTDIRHILADIETVKKEFFSTNFVSQFANDTICTLEFFAKLIHKHCFNEIEQEIIDLLNSITDYAFIVGGFIRDIIMYKPYNNIDFVVDLSHGVLVNEFAVHGFDIDIDSSFITVSKKGYVYKIAQFFHNNIYTDADARDFTVNTLYYSLKTNRLFDPTGMGLNDLSSRVLRFNGDPMVRIKEDFTRVFRFYGFLKKGFNPHSKSLHAVRFLFDEVIKNTDSKKIRNEIEKICL